jgi:hypothetical protein
MRLFLFVFVYGMLALTGAALAWIWTRIAVKRVAVLGRGELMGDRYFWLAAALGVNSIGSVVLFGTRAWTNLTQGISPMLIGIDGALIFFGLAVVLAAKGMMVWLADLEREHPRWLWGMGLLVLVWGGFCAWMANGGEA